MMPFIDLKTQYKKLKNKIDSRILNVLEHGQYVMGPEIVELENLLAKFTGAKHCIAVSSGTDAQMMALMALGLGPGDEVIIPDFSFFATAEVVLLVGATPVFVDIDEKTYNLDPQLLEKAITKKTKAIMPVSLYGQTADFDVINNIAKKYSITVIEDAAQSFGAKYKDRYSCSLTTLAATSFFPSKPLGCYGDGGACFTSDDTLAEKLKVIRVHGQTGRYVHSYLGINGRMDSIQAAILIEKMTLFSEELKLRLEVAQRYDELLKGIIPTPFIAKNNTSAYAQYTIEVSNRKIFCDKLMELGVPTAVHYPGTLSEQPVIKNKYNSNSPVAARVCQRVVSLPFGPYLDLKSQKEVVEAIKKSL